MYITGHLLISVKFTDDRDIILNWKFYLTEQMHHPDTAMSKKMSFIRAVQSKLQKL